MLAKPFQTKPELKHNQKPENSAINSLPKRKYRNQIPKIADKEIPLHNFGLNVAHLPLSKQLTYKSKVWKVPRKQSSLQQQRPKSLYNRPVQLLKHYLQRKQKVLFQPLIVTNPQTLFQQQVKSQQLYHTANEFRVKKAHRKLLAVQPKNPVHNQLEQMKSHPSYSEEIDFMSLNIAKNIYDMTHEQLEQSIRWKKHFLEALTQKVRQSKTTGFTQRVRS